MSKKRQGKHPEKEKVANIKGGKGKKNGAKNDKKKGKKNQNNLYTESDMEFRRQLEANDYAICEMDADGNCMFRALSDQLYGDCGNKYYADIREEVVNYLEDHEDEFKFFVVDDDGKEDEDFSASFQDYVSRMRQDGEWAGNTELVCASRCFHRTIAVFTSSGTLKIDYVPEQSNLGKNNVVQQDAAPLCLSYHDNDHYNSCHASNKPDIQQNKERRPKEVIEPNRKQKKNDACACGSRRKYKKCCFMIENRQKRLAKVQVANEVNKDDDHEGSYNDSSSEVEGNFKVLRI